MSGPLAGRTALITGASSGIGRGAAIALAAAGAAVVLCARRADRLDGVVRQVEAAGGQAFALPGDIADEAVAIRAVEATVERFGRLDVLVNSAGVSQTGRVENADTAEWRRVMDINFMASLYTCKAAIPPMKAQGGGDIVNISSTAGRRAGSASMGPYSSSKHALTVMTEGLRQEVGGHGIRVCIVEPGATNTEVGEGIRDAKMREAIRNHVSKEGVLQVDDVAAAIVFVVSLPAHVNISEILIRPTSDTIPM